jgi:hypothetical protein
MTPGTTWLPADEELPVRVKRIIASEKGRPIVFWGIHGMAYYCWLSKDDTLDPPFFCEEVLNTSPTRTENATELQKLAKLDFDSYGQCKSSHGKGNPREIRSFPIQTHAAAIVEPGDCIVRSFLFGWLKTQLERMEYNGENELYEAVYEILTGHSIEMIETVFVDWMNRLQCLIDGSGDNVS